MNNLFEAIGITAVILVAVLLLCVIFWLSLEVIELKGQKPENNLQAQIDYQRESIGVEARKRRELELDQVNQMNLIKKLYQAVSKDRKAMASFKSSLRYFQHETRNHGAQMISLREDVGEYMIKLESMEEGWLEQKQDTRRRFRNISDHMGIMFSGQEEHCRAIECLKKGKANKVTPKKRGAS